MPEKDDLIFLGYTGKPHGIKGEISVKWFAEFIPEAHKRIFLQKDKILSPFSIISVKPHKDRLLFSLKGVETRNEAENLAGMEVLMLKRDLPPLEDGEVYLQELLGSEIFLEDGTKAGILENFEFPVGQEIWIIRQEDGKELLLPAREEFIADIDPLNKKITIQPPAGLLDIYRA